MKVTESDDIKHRQLQCEGYLQRVSAEQRGYAEACESPKMTETDSTNTNEQREGLLEQIVNRENLYRAYKQVKSNKGAGGIDKRIRMNSCNLSWTVNTVQNPFGGSKYPKRTGRQEN